MSGHKGILDDHGGQIQRDRRSNELRQPAKARLHLLESSDVRHYDQRFRPYHVALSMHHALRCTLKAVEGG